MIIKKIKKKYFVVDALINYPIIFKNDNIFCVCHKFSDNKSNDFCEHIKYFLNYCGMDVYLLDHWLRIKEDVIKLIQKPNFRKINNEDLWEIIDKKIVENYCGFCLNKILNNTNVNYHVCSDCQGIVHETCFIKWNKAGNGCMLCRGIKDL